MKGKKQVILRRRRSKTEKPFERSDKKKLIDEIWKCGNNFRNGKSKKNGIIHNNYT